MSESIKKVAKGKIHRIENGVENSRTDSRDNLEEEFDIYRGRDLKVKKGTSKVV